MSKRIERGRRQDEKPPTLSVPASPDVPIRDGSPTTLTLFQFSEERLAQVVNRRDAALAFRKDFDAINVVYRNYDTAATTRLNDNNNLRKKHNVQRGKLRSSRVVSNAYVTMTDELTAKGATPQEAFDFFTKGVEISSHISPQLDVLLQTRARDAQVLANTLQSTVAKKCGVEQLFKRAVAVVPAWFDRGRKEWVLFVAHHVVFQAYFNDANLVVSPKGLPDWYVAAADQLPTRDIALAEYQQDLQQRTIFEEIDRLANQHFFAIQRAGDEVYVKAAIAVELQKRDAFPTIQELPEVLLLLHTMPDVTEYSLPTDKLKTATHKDLTASTVGPKDLRSKIIRAFAASQEFSPSAEVIALFLEDRLREGGIIQDAKEPMTDNAMGALTLMLNTLNSDIPQAEQFFQLLEKTHPHLFRVLNNDIQPLLSLVPDQEIRELTDTIASWSGEEFELIIWELARVIQRVSQKRNLKTETQSVKATLGKVKTFIADWLTKYGEESYNELEQQVSDKRGEIPHVNEEPSPSLIQEQIKTIEEVTREIALGNLGGWSLYYASEPTTDTQQLTPIGGETMAEREEQIKQFFGEHTIPGDAKEIVELVEWLVVVPQDVEKTREDRFTRMKLGDLRILYFVDPLKKEVVFSGVASQGVTLRE